jgi:ketosteroid isomerase-like protein
MSHDADEGRRGLAEIERRWSAAAQPWNPAALCLIYTGDALLMGGRPGHSVGRERIRGYFSSYVNVIESASLELKDQHLVVLGQSRYLAQGEGHFEFHLADGKRSSSVLRTTLVIVGPAPWSIQAQHFSPTPETPPLGHRRQDQQ